MTKQKPTYIDYINHFWRVNEEFGFSSFQAHLYFALLSVFNRRAWGEEICVSDFVLCEMMSVSNNTLRKSRKVLMEQNLISFIKGGKGYGNKTRYQLRHHNLTPSLTPNLTPKLKPIPIYKTKEYKTKEYNNNNKNFNYGTKKGFDISKGDFN